MAASRPAKVGLRPDETPFRRNEVGLVKNQLRFRAHENGVGRGESRFRLNQKALETSKKHKMDGQRDDVQKNGAKTAFFLQFHRP